MKTLIQLIENVLQGDVFTKASRQFNNPKKPTNQSKTRTFDGPRIGGTNDNGTIQKVSRIRKDKSSSYKQAHPTTNSYITNTPLQIISIQKAAQMIDNKVNLPRAIKKAQETRRPINWYISNSSTQVIYDPTKGPQGSFFIKN